MKKNMGSVDKAFRISFAIIVTILFTTGTITGTLGELYCWYWVVFF